ncbi:Protein DETOXIFICATION 46 [Durusdinium trenchii]|uniref:Chloroplastic (AtDTX46) (Multidrug and toxic compound extrusion protein 46) (MATE protein 46) (Protein EDS5 HOMOLOGUE) n=1 Tax=Durusdinium trenchii TaxID=1381693 RepID=A0ABP0KDE2_9DINO
MQVVAGDSALCELSWDPLGLSMTCTTTEGGAHRQLTQVTLPQRLPISHGRWSPDLLRRSARSARSWRIRRSALRIDPVLVAHVGRQACVGALAAVVAALLQAFTEPVLNRVAVKRMRLSDAIREVRLIDILRFFRTVLATNLLKFPFFEAVNDFSTSWSFIPYPLQGTLAAVIYTSAVLPLANYRYIKSLQLKVKFKKLYQAYFPTLLRDLIYGVTRHWMMIKLATPYKLSVGGEALRYFVSIAVACLASAPGNELRAYRLQPKKSRRPMSEFFELQPFLRSAMLGALIPATAIASGHVLVSQAEVMGKFFLRGLELMPRHWVPVVFIMIWAVLKLESTRQYYDPYAQSRMLRTMRAEARNRGQGSRSQVAASVATSSPARIVETISDPLESQVEPRGGKEVYEIAVPSTAEIAKFVVPSFCLVVANSSMTTVDKAFLGQSSSLQLAAMGPAASVFDSASLVLTFLNTATLSLLGMTKSPRQLRKIRSHAIFLATSSGLILTGSLVTFAGPLTRFMGATNAMLPLSVAYLQIRALGAAIERGTSVATSFCLAAKDGATPLIVTLVGLLVNVLGDALLCPKYGLAGVAAASVLAAACGYGYFIRSLWKSQRWPQPFIWPRNFRSISRFLQFAGPVLLAVFLKMLVLANMTTAACSFGTTSAATHQLFQTLFLLSAVAIGNPFSWAAQAFLPPILTAVCVEQEPGPSSRKSFQTLRKLLCNALILSVTASVSVVIFCHKLGWILSSDPDVLRDMARTSLALVPFLSLYPVLLTLEGALYGAQERSTVLWLSILFWWTSSTAIGIMQFFGTLSLCNMWLTVGISCGLTTLVTAILTFRALLVPKCKLILER